MEIVTRRIIDSFYRELENLGQECHGAIIIQDGKVLENKSFYPFDNDVIHPVYSCTKSLTSLAIGVLSDEGKIDINNTWISYFPEYEKDASESFKEVTIKDILTMSSGYDTEPVILYEDDPYLNVINKETIYKKGTYFYYNTAASNLLSPLVKKISGLKLSEFVNERIFKPLDIKEYYWQDSNIGDSLGGYGLELSTSSLAKLGVMLLNKGIYNGKRVISESYIQEATSKQIDNADKYPLNRNESRQGYGYLFWLCTNDGYRIAGMHGQLVYIQPKNKLIVATTMAGDFDEQILNAWNKAFTNPTNEEYEKESIDVISGNNIIDPEDLTIFGKHLAVENSHGYKSLTINRIDSETLLFEFEKDGSIYSITSTYDKWCENKQDMTKFSKFAWDNLESKVKSKPLASYSNYAYKNKTKLKMQIRQLDKTSAWNFSFHIDKKYINLCYSVNALFTEEYEYEVAFRL